ncbi:DEAD/DEAH box helicase family protein [Babesia bovis T2Bo]|uniref:DEAD/DEAH box helicase domain containing protein n=1 Tax=Babesia bovis TaxID=5865 RepID=A7AMF4_BABBO|nr:DEAD/DEAH box helicase family protein [Babesia bovis T2Bo]EDO07738.1 DEAD/DEAH box helicase family protein [Babesia bovis T2Bo]|eukprot:XP_001611306.1 DEAD/DEAH box helicase domain containing protein [Babesia bovis T2Bo]
MADKFDDEAPVSKVELMYDIAAASAAEPLRSGRQQSGSPRSEAASSSFHHGDKFEPTDGIDTIDYGSLGILNIECAKSLRCDPSVPLKSRLKLWHAMCPTDFSNLLGSAGAKESCCIVHAESLIVHIVCSAEKEGNVLLDFAKGPQTLQLIYRVERILSGIIRCGGTFMLVFFDVFRKLFDPGYGHAGEDGEDQHFFDGYLLLREILLTHVVLNGISHMVFRDWYDPEWVSYVDNNEPAFIMIEDGSSFLYKHRTLYEIVDTTSSSPLNEPNGEIVADFEVQQSYMDRFTFATQSLAMHSLSINLCVAYFFELGPFAHNFKAFISFPSNCLPPTQFIEELESQFMLEYPLEERVDADGSGTELVQQIMSDLGTLGIDCRLRHIVACNYLRSLIEMKPDADDEVDEDTALYIDSCELTFKVLLIHNHLLDLLSLEDRCTLRLDAEGWEFFSTYIAATLDFMTSTTVPVLCGLSSVVDTMADSRRDAADLFDGNLFTSILHSMAIYASDHGNKVDLDCFMLDKEVVSQMDRMYAHFSQNSGATVFPIDMSPFASCGIYDTVGTVDSHSGAQDGVLNVDNQFVNMYFGLTEDKVIKFYEGDNSRCMERFAALQWRNPALMSEKTECIDYYFKVEKQDKMALLPNRSQRQEQRSMQRQNAFSHLLSRYLGSNNLHHPIVPKLEHQWLDVKQRGLEENADASAAASGKKDAKKVKESKKDKSAKDAKKDKGTKVKTSAKAELLRQKHAAAQESKSREGDLKTFERLSSRLGSIFSAEHDFDSIYTSILDYTSGPSRAVDLVGDFKWLKGMISTKPIQLQFVRGMLENLLKTFDGYRMRSLNKKGARASFRRTICMTIRLIHDCFKEFKSLIDGETITLLQRFLCKLGLSRSAANLFNEWLKLNDDKKNKKFKVDSDERFEYALRDGMEFDFQLAYMGDLMERTLGSTEDPRVLFKPDAWQKILLDTVDNRESSLVVAPTSTGKTYICYYAMEQGLRLDDEGIVIYVSPNNALALQVKYEITARFSSKNYSSPSCAAVLSATFLDNFHDPKWNCAQILVTVPSILEQLLVAMRSSELGYIKRIEYLIFDEIHCISDEEIGPFMERIIHLSAAPFMALSATVGNPLEFHAWLTKVERTRRNSATAKVHYIYFDERYSDLKLECYSNRHLVPLNPATCLSYHNVLRTGFPRDCYLRPRDLFVLSRCTDYVMGSRCSDMAYLSPAEYFRNTPLITKRQYRYWLQTYITEFARQVQESVITADDFQKIMDCLKSLNVSVSPGDAAAADEPEDHYFRLYPLLKPMDPVVDCPGNDAPISVQSRDYLDPAEVITLLNTLEQTKRLPCLAFTFDRNHMEHVLVSVTQLLKRRQWEKYYGTPEATAWTNAENKRRVDHYQMLMRQYEAEKKMRGASREQKEEQGIGGKVEEFIELPKEPVDVAEDYDPEFNYYNRKIYVNYTEEVENFIKVAAASISNRKQVDTFVEALRRGIGIHHEGLPHKFTMLTETLYRMGFLKVLFSGRSLAFGINVPCKSVIFMGDNYELTPLMYKQMSGRCGRRGFDLSGHVVFWGLPMKRIRQLLTAQLGNLTGYASCSPTEVLATLSAFNSLLVSVRSRPPQPKVNSKISTTDARVRKTEIITRSRDYVVDPRIIVKRLASMFIHPLKPHSGFSKDEVIVFRACVETLFELGFIDRHGLVSGCCELALLTRESHPSNMFLAHLAQMGKLHDLTLSTGSDSADKLMDIVARFAYKRQQLGTCVTLRRLLPQRVRCGAKYNSRLVSNLNLKDEGSLSVELLYPESFPLLPSARGEVKDLITVYNAQILGILSKYQAKLEPMQPTLPLSKVDFCTGTKVVSSWFMEKRGTTKFQSLASPFVAINGLPGNFSSARELWLSSRACSDITLDMVPTIESVEVDVVQMDPHYNVLNRYGMTLDNSYIIDYWTHGRFSVVRDVNGLGQYAWFDLRKILVLLKLAKLTLNGYTDGGVRQDSLNDAVVHALDRFESVFNRI